MPSYYRNSTTPVPTKGKPSATQSAAQQAVLNNLRAGGTIRGAQPNNPLAYAAQFFDPRRFFDSKPSTIPTLKGGMVNGREALVAPGGWNQGTAGLGEITVGGQRFFPAQSGKDLVYQRAPGQIGGQYGSIRVPDQLASSVEEIASTPAERAYQQEKARVTQMTEQDPMFKKYQVAELSKQYNAAKGDEREKIGMQIWAQTNPELAAKLRPGATGYSDVATAFQKLSPVGNLAGSMAPSNFPMPAVDSNTMPTVEQAFGTNAPQFNIPGMDTSAMTTAVAPGAFSQPLSTDITEYLTDPVKAYAPTEKVDQTKLALLRQAYNQRLK
jgi:hypothetical protein